MERLIDYFHEPAVRKILEGLDSRTPQQEAHLLLIRAGEGEVPAEQALNACRKLDLITNRDPDTFLLLHQWALIAGENDDHIQEALACTKLARAVAVNDAATISPMTHMLARDAMLHYRLHDYEQFLDCGMEALKLARSGKPGLQSHVTTVLTPCFAMLGCLSMLQNDIDQIVQSKPPAQIRDRLLPADLIEATETFRIDEANAVLERCSHGHHININPAGMAYMCQQLLQLYANMFPRQVSAPVPTPFGPDSVHNNALEEVAVVRTICEHLYDHKPKEALELCYATIKAHNDPQYFITPGIAGYSLLRAELANGNISAAYRTMNMRDDAGLSHPLDSFFQARIALLQDGIDNAHAWFYECLSGMDALKARNRIFFELALASEIPRPVLLEWSRMLHETPSSQGKRAKHPKKKGGTPPASTAPIPVTTIRPKPDRADPRGIARLVGKSGDLDKVRHLIIRMAEKDVPMLITGQTGTGKEVVAWAVHEESQRSSHPYMAINCAALGDSLLSSELFGHERGAFTGASEKYQGLIRAAGKGTLLLDEIGEITPTMQASLLRVLETGEFRPVGSTRILAMSCRILAATNQDLGREVQAGRFRQDLFYRLQRLHIHLSPLSERKEDILPLAYHFFSWGRADSEQVILHQDLQEALLAHGWLGNVRELRNTIERIRLFHGDKAEYELDDALEFLPSVKTVDHAKGAPPSQDMATSDQKEDNSGSLPNRESARSPIRLEQATLRLLQKHETMTRKEVAYELSITPHTATKYLKILIKAGHIEKVMPSRSARSHYFRLKKDS